MHRPRELATYFVKAGTPVHTKADTVGKAKRYSDALGDKLACTIA